MTDKQWKSFCRDPAESTCAQSVIPLPQFHAGGLHFIWAEVSSARGEDGTASSWSSWLSSSYSDQLTKPCESTGERLDKLALHSTMSNDMDRSCSAPSTCSSSCGSHSSSFLGQLVTDAVNDDLAADMYLTGFESRIGAGSTPRTFSSAPTCSKLSNHADQLARGVLINAKPTSAISSVINNVAAETRHMSVSPVDEAICRIRGSGSWNKQYARFLESAWKQQPHGRGRRDYMYDFVEHKMLSKIKSMEKHRRKKTNL